MINLSINGESSSTAPQDEGPLSSSLAQRASSLSIPKISQHLIADLILPFVADRGTWNSVYSASKDLCLRGKTMTPPWPSKAFNMMRHGHVPHVGFSPSGLQLAFCILNRRTAQYNVHVWDRWGKEVLLGGRTKLVCCLEYSLDGDYLASGSEDGLIRIWHTESFHNNTSKPHMGRPTRTPKNADTILGRGSVLMALSFSRNDSNLLASGEHNGEIKVWNIKEQACIHSFNPGRGWIPALFFAGGVEVACIAVAEDGSIIRLWRGEGSTDFASEIIGNAGLPRTSPKPVFSPSGSFLATRIRSTGNASTVELFELATFETRSVVMPHFTPTRIAVTDTKQLVVGDRNGRIRILQTEDFSIQPDLDPSGEVRAMPPPVASPVVSVAFDPACRVLAIGCCDGRFELRTL